MLDGLVLSEQEATYPDTLDSTLSLPPVNVCECRKGSKVTSQLEKY